MIKAIIRALVLAAVVVVAAQFVPWVAANEPLLLVLALVAGLAGLFMRALFVLVLAVAALVAYFYLLH